MEEDLKEMLGKRPDELEGETLKLFNAIMKIADERDELKLKCKELKEIEENHRKENGELREQVKELEEDLTSVYLKGIYDERDKWIALVKEKIEELDNKRRKFTSDNVNNFYLQEFTRKYTQKSDHDYGVFSTPETITYCTNNELLGRVEVLQDLLERSK